MWAMQTANLSVPIQFKIESKSQNGLMDIE
jgi:hypothetical protein